MDQLRMGEQIKGELAALRLALAVGSDEAKSAACSAIRRAHGGKYPGQQDEARSDREARRPEAQVTGDEEVRE